MATIYKCRFCGSVVVKMNDGVGCTPSCCGEQMTALKAGSTDGALEKHVPVVTVSADSVHVSVGSVAHPMAEDHYIEWIILVTDRGYQTKFLHPGDKPEADFVLAKGEKVVEALEYCNKHGLWSGK